MARDSAFSNDARDTPEWYAANAAAAPSGYEDIDGVRHVWFNQNLMLPGSQASIPSEGQFTRDGRIYVPESAWVAAHPAEAGWDDSLWMLPMLGLGGIAAGHALGGGLLGEGAGAGGNLWDIPAGETGAFDLGGSTGTGLPGSTGGGGVPGGSAATGADGAFDYSFDGTGIDPSTGLPTGPTTPTTPELPTTPTPNPPVQPGTPTLPTDVLPGGVDPGGVVDWEDLFPDVGDVGGLLNGINWGDILRGGAAGAGSYFSSEHMADELGRISDRNFNIGAPFRALNEASYQPGFDLLSQPGYGDAMNRLSEISTRNWSPAGNPANNPGIQGNIMNDVWNQGYLPALTNYRGGLTSAGNTGLSDSTQTAMAAVNAMGNAWQGVGYGANTALGGLFPGTTPMGQQNSLWGAITGQGQTQTGGTANNPWRRSF